MYGDNFLSDGKIYTKLLNESHKEESVISSIAERCPKNEVDWGINSKSKWDLMVSNAINQVAEVNPYLPDINVGDEVSALSAIAWVKGAQNLDCRPKVFDGTTQSWKLLDTGSSVTVVRKSQNDKKDESKGLKAVNGSKIDCYGQKVIEVRIGRKTYPILATIADVDQDILGWDFLVTHKLSFEWSEFGDLYIVDKLAQTKNPLKFVALPVGSLPTQKCDWSGRPSHKTLASIESFEIASMRSLKCKEESIPEDIPENVQEIINKYPGILTPSFNDLSTKHGVTHTQ